MRFLLQDPKDLNLNLKKNPENETKNTNKEKTKSKKQKFFNKFIEVSGLLFAQDKTFWRLVALLSVLFACVGWLVISYLPFQILSDFIV